MSKELTHPGIIDGWFKETGTMWPGQAFSLQVKEILHVEKSKYQDVLVFESTNWGNVLVLDGAIQCVEKDEFSYQEMLTHLPMASHPNPKRVLVIGGGDGGVCREVVKHPSVEEVILCDIDEAVPRVSKMYLPEMAKGLDHSKVTVYIGDGFEFLQRPENQNAFDVIITDSSDPEGPAEALFSRSYFELLKAALREGGQLATQAECQWIHLPLITKLHSATKELFPVAEYAFTTIPSYPCGQIGFIVCSKDPSATVRKPKRQITGTKYYSSDVHQASFVLPKFAKEALESGQSLTSTISQAVTSVKDTLKGQNKILLLGSGFVTAPTVEYLSRRSENRITVGCRTLAAAEDLAKKYPRCSATSVDVNDSKSLDSAISEHDLVISLIPYTYHVPVIKSAIKYRKNVVTTSYVSPAMEELDAEAKAAGVTVLNEVGLDPGIDHFYAVKTIDEVHQMGGKITAFLSYCGGLPAPEASDNPLGYKFSWSSRGVLLALQNSAKFYQDGRLEEVPGDDLMSFAKPYYITPAYAFVAYPNRDSTAYKKRYNIPEAETVIRGTLRYQGFPQFIKALVQLKMLDASEKDYLKPGAGSLAWNQVLQKVTGAKSTEESDLLDAIRQRCSFSDKMEEQRIIAGFRWIGLFSEVKVRARGNLLDTLCATLEEKMQYGPGERDLVMLQHKFGIEWSDGRKETRTSTLEAYGEPFGASAMARTVGLPCGVATQLVLDGVITRKGICAPMDMEICAPIMKILKEQEGISMVEKVI